jgi:acyl carrier protein
MHDEIYGRLTSLFRDVFDDDTLVATPSMTAKDVAEWDSLNHIRLIVAIEKAFGIAFTTAEVAGFANVAQLVDVVAARASPPRSSPRGA